MSESEIVVSIALGGLVAAIAEILAYYMPGVDNLLDTIATPAALVAGTIAAAAVVTDLPPVVKWTTAVIAGGGAAAAASRIDDRDGRARQRGRLDRRAKRRFARLAARAARAARGGRDPRGVLLARHPLRAPAVSPDPGGADARMSCARAELPAGGQRAASSRAPPGCSQIERYDRRHPVGPDCLELGASGR
jgi:hypothetical protein